MWDVLIQWKCYSAVDLIVLLKVGGAAAERTLLNGEGTKIFSKFFFSNRLSY